MLPAAFGLSVSGGDNRWLQATEEQAGTDEVARRNRSLET